ncbi:hypothetical protein HZC07_04445 [Candidatus Micrarchaeota archaeon]|nr:hypothetical protein [Candidatus Micrarchaeota archaeon]
MPKKQYVVSYLGTGLVAFISLFLTTLLWQQPVLLTVLLGILIAFVLLLWKNEQDLWLFLFAMIAGPLFDFVATATNTWQYGKADFFGVPLWLPFLYGLAGVYIVKVAQEIRRQLGEKTKKEPFWKYMIGNIVAVVVLVISGIIWNNPLLLTGVLLVFSIGLYLLWQEETIILVYIFAMIVGPIFDMIATKTGAWYYPMPDFLDIPIWLPLLYGLAAIYVTKGSEFIENYFMKKISLKNWIRV